MGDEERGGTNSTDKMKALWKNLPKSAKLTILGGVAAILLVLLGAGVFMSLMPSNFLDYSNDAQESDDLKAEYEDYWAEMCEEGDSNCSEEQIKAAEKLKEDQTNFYQKLDKLVSKYTITQEQKYIVLTTIFYGMDIDDFTAGTAFTIDDTDEINYEVKAGENMYEREQDSLKELIKQFKVNTALCYYVTYDENNQRREHKDSMVNEYNENFTLNFFEKFLVSIGREIEDEEFNKEATECRRRTEGKVIFEDSTTSKASIDGYYKYLRESTYFDDKPHLLGYFSDYGRRHGLSNDLSTWPKEELQAVRDDIIEDIKDIVKEHVDEKGLATSFGTGKAYWWPIGSKETTTENGVTFASGEPEFTLINSPFGMRTLDGTTRFHSGIDLHGTMGETNIIASLGGKVTMTNNTCPSNGSLKSDCGGGYGNYVFIEDTKGNITVYAHMYKDSITVAVGDQVSQGQVIGKIGSSGRSSGKHLHFGIKVNGEFRQPLDYVDQENPRPEGLGLVDFNNSRYSKQEFITKLNQYYSNSSVCNSNRSQFVQGCNSFKEEVLHHGGAEKIYDTASSKNLNPELVVARSLIEGYSPGKDYNYFGYNCTNTGGGRDCKHFTSFQHAMETFFNNIAQYDSVEAMMSRYAYIGKYWYTGEHPGLGGCYYAEYIYPDGVPSRVTAACNHPDGYCSAENTANCVPTTEEDQAAYTAWQAGKMAKTMEGIFK